MLKKRVKDLLEKFRTKNYHFRNIYRWCRNRYMALKYWRIRRQNPIDEKMVLFESFLGRQYSDSPKAIYQCMQQMPEFADFTFIWVFRKKVLKRNRSSFTDPRVKLVLYGSGEYYRCCASTKYWVTNWRTKAFTKKKKGQVLIETWHGTPLKKIGIDSEINNEIMADQKKKHKMYLDDAKQFDYVVSPSAFCTRVFTTAFGLDQLHKEDILIETGYPRNDYLLTYQEEDLTRIREKLSIPTDKKVILYAPTWRDNQHELGVGNVMDIAATFFWFLDHLPDDYLVLMRLHYLVANRIDLSAYEGKALNCSKYDDINDLYIISDMLVTDYSSVFFDYANLGKPILFYMYDLEEYQTEIRDFYIDLDELPGPILQTQQELLNTVLALAPIQQQYREKYQKFCDTYTYLDDGHAAERVVAICMPESQCRGEES